MAEVTEAYPLTWPPGWPRTPAGRRRSAKFVKGKGGLVNGGWVSPKRLDIGDGIGRILRELRAMGVPQRNIIVSSDLRLRQDGLPVSNQAHSHLDPGVAVYWHYGRQTQRCMAIDHYDRIADNLAAIAATIDAMRAIKRHGGAEILERAFSGFMALPAPAQQEQPHQILGVDENATAAEINYAYRRMAQQCHPDMGGSHEAMARINQARDAMLAALARKAG